jgi:hypothetical protein
MTRSILFSVAVCLSLSGCALVLCFIDTDLSKDPRFKNVVGHEIRTKQTLYLDAPDNRRPEKLRHVYDLDATSMGKEVLAAVVPVGHPVKFTKVIRKHVIDHTADYMYGEITLKGRTYPISLFLGISLFPDEWRKIHDMFEIEE